MLKVFSLIIIYCASHMRITGQIGSIILQWFYALCMIVVHASLYMHCNVLVVSVHFSRILKINFLSNLIIVNCRLPETSFQRNTNIDTRLLLYSKFFSLAFYLLELSKSKWYIEKCQKLNCNLGVFPEDFVCLDERLLLWMLVDFVLRYIFHLE